MRFRGRDAESELLLHQLVGADLLVLFGKPGLGKTSLLNARLFPLLSERDFLPLPIRFNQVDSLSPIQVFIAAIEQACTANEIDYTLGDPSGLWEFFKTAVFWRGDRFQTLASSEGQSFERSPRLKCVLSNPGSRIASKPSS